MDRFSFLNAAHTQFFADLYEQYTVNPDSVEPSWRAFFQGFDFAKAHFDSEVPDNVLKEFKVLIIPARSFLLIIT